MLHLANVQSDLEVGQYVVIDPTGRELLDCAEVGRVVGFTDIGASVELNGSGGIVGGVNDVFAVLPRDEPRYEVDWTTMLPMDPK